MKITASDLAQRLTGNEYGLEVSEAEARVAKESGLVIVYGYSDDNMEFEGAIHDEVGCYDGGKAFVSKSGEVYADDGCVPEDAQQNVIEAIWCARDSDAAWSYRTDMKIFKKKAPVIVLDEGPLSGKIVVVGTMGQTCRFGALKICKYADGELHEYGAPLEVKDVGEPLVTIVFGSKEGVKRLSDSLYALYRKMEDAPEPPKEVE